MRRQVESQVYNKYLLRFFIADEKEREKERDES